MDKMESVSVNNSDVGLDRSAINYHGQIQLAHRETPIPPSSSNTTALIHPQSPGSHRTVQQAFDERRHATTNKLRKVFHISKPSDEQSSSPSSILANATSEPTSARLIHEMPLADKVTVKDLLRNPVDTIKDKISSQGSQQVAANVAVKEISHAREVNLINAQDRVELAGTDAEKLLAIEDLDKLIKERQNIYVRWTMDRHVTKCRVLPRDSFVSKSRSDFQRKTTEGNTEVDWAAYKEYQIQYYAQQYGGQYIGLGSNPPAPSKLTIMPNVERVIIASAPLQQLIMTARRIYRWEDPAETSKYLVVYLALWYLNVLFPGMLSAMVYLVVHRHFYGDTLEDVRTDLKRTEDVHQTALSLTELIEKEGDELWTERIVQELGPWLMLQLCDAASLFEVMRNFYEWRVPSQTMATLSIFLCTILFTTFTPVWLIVKCMTFSAGVTFFGLFPLATNFTDYRLLASIPKRIFWNIPTHAEWAIKSLQAEGARYRRSTQPEIELGASVDYGFYTGNHNGHRGRLIISTSSIRFETNIGHQVIWTLSYDNIIDLEKIDRLASKTMSKAETGKDLSIIGKLAGEEHTWVLVDVDGRDQAFSQIVGFSKTTWQVVW